MQFVYKLSFSGQFFSHEHCLMYRCIVMYCIVLYQTTIQYNTLHYITLRCVHWSFQISKTLKALTMTAGNVGVAMIDMSNHKNRKGKPMTEIRTPIISSVVTATHNPIINSILDEINATQTHRGVAVLAAGLVESLVIDLMKNVLIAHKDLERLMSRGNLGTLRTFAYTTGIIPKELYIDLKKVADIRNQFAHYIEIQSFDDTKISEWIKQLSPLKQNVSMGGNPTIGRDGSIAKDIRDLDLRTQFIFAVSWITVHLEQIKTHSTPFAAPTRPYP